MNDLMYNNDLVNYIFEYTGINELKYINKKIENIRKQKINKAALIINKYIYKFIKSKKSSLDLSTSELRVYVKKYYPYKLRETAIIFYVSNIYRYNYDDISQELFNMINLLTFMMDDVPINDRFFQLIDLLDNKQFNSFYDSIIKFNVIYKMSKR